PAELVCGAAWATAISVINSTTNNLRISFLQTRAAACGNNTLDCKLAEAFFCDATGRMVQHFRYRAGFREFVGIRIRLPTAPRESRPDRPPPELHCRPSSGPRCGYSAGRYRTLLPEYEGISPRQTPATILRASLHNTHNKFCEIPTPWCKTNTAGSVCRRRPPPAAPPLPALPCSADTDSQRARLPEPFVSLPVIPHTDRSEFALQVL